MRQIANNISHILVIKTGVFSGKHTLLLHLYFQNFTRVELRVQ